MGSLVNVLSMGGSLTAAVVLLVLWQFKNLRVNVVGAYRIFFPFVITSFLLLPIFCPGSNISVGWPPFCMRYTAWPSCS